MDCPETRVLRALLVAVAAAAAACGTAAPAAVGDGGDAGTPALDAPAGDTDAPSAPMACNGPEDCIDFPVGPAVSCCLDKRCFYGQSALDAVPCTDADVELILASNYDQSCRADSDCMEVGEGNFCNPGEGNCGGAAINKSAYPQYQADVAKTNAATCRAISGCGSIGGPCCRQGSCRGGSECFTPQVDASPESGARDGGAQDGGAGEGAASGGGCDASCGVGRVCCAGQCVDTGNDPTNCGSCGVHCGSGSYCNGSCQPIPCSHAGTCAAASTCCGSSCCTVDQLCCQGSGVSPTCYSPTSSGATCPQGCTTCSGG